MPCTRGIIIFQYQPFNHEEYKISSHACYVELATCAEHGSCWRFSTDGKAPRPVQDLNSVEDQNTKVFSDQLRYLHKAVLLVPTYVSSDAISRFNISSEYCSNKYLQQQALGQHSLALRIGQA